MTLILLNFMLLIIPSKKCENTTEKTKQNKIWFFEDNIIMSIIMILTEIHVMYWI